ncbi:hypothetical protein T484DRAFT_1897209 [Baffinella frigidus]|nr:hypothetical protein T484DRAFT_1897209 [Cryptophyta sp. CCMP2293]
MVQGGRGDLVQEVQPGDFQGGPADYDQPVVNLATPSKESEVGSTVEVFFLGRFRRAHIVAADSESLTLLYVADDMTAGPKGLKERILRASNRLPHPETPWMNWRVGSAVEALFEEEWWEAHVISVNGDLLRIHYVGDDESCEDEEILRGSNRLRAPQQVSNAPQLHSDAQQNVGDTPVSDPAAARSETSSSPASNRSVSPQHDSDTPQHISRATCITSDSPQHVSDSPQHDSDAPQYDDGSHRSASPYDPPDLRCDSPYDPPDDHLSNQEEQRPTISRLKCPLPADDSAVWADIAPIQSWRKGHLDALREALGGPRGGERVPLASGGGWFALEGDINVSREIFAIYAEHFSLDGAGCARLAGNQRAQRCFHLTFVRTGQRCCDTAIKLRVWIVIKLAQAVTKRKRNSEVGGGDVSRRRVGSDPPHLGFAGATGSVW